MTHPKGGRLVGLGPTRGPQVPLIEDILPVSKM
jgi:hypothetical protein